MIEFNVISTNKAIKRIPKEYPKLTQYEADFRIIVDDKLFFHEPNFPLLEFLRSANDWKNQGCDSFEFVSLETEDNPLISFICKKDMWIIYSPWQLFECKTEFTKEQLVSAIDALEKMIGHRGRFSVL